PLAPICRCRRGEYTRHQAAYRWVRWQSLASLARRSAKMRGTRQALQYPSLAQSTAPAMARSSRQRPGTSRPGRGPCGSCRGNSGAHSWRWLRRRRLSRRWGNLARSSLILHWIGIVEQIAFGGVVCYGLIVICLALGLAVLIFCFLQAGFIVVCPFGAGAVLIILIGSGSRQKILGGDCIISLEEVP